MAAKKKTTKKNSEEAKPKRQVAMVTLDDGTQMKRTDYIRKRFLEGASRSEIAKELGIPYQYVWQATRKLKKAEDEAPANDSDGTDHDVTNYEVPADDDEEIEEDF